jgi:uncharacterized protein YkwD
MFRSSSVPVRVLFSSFLLALLLATGISTTATAAPKAKVALGAQKAKKPAKAAKKAKKSKKAAKRKKVVKRGKSPVTHTANNPVVVVAPPVPAECANTAVIPTPETLEQVRAAIVCLHNQIRAQHGLTTLADNAQLTAAAAGHSADMVANGFFDHTTPVAGTFVERVIGAGYAGADDAWTLGENLAWGTGVNATPAGMINAWLNSPGHRDNLLGRAYTEIGVGVRLGTPTGNAAGATVSVEFGARP